MSGRGYAGAALALLALAAPLAAQEAPPTTANTRVDVELQLDIAERRITETDFQASLAVEIDPGQAQGLALQIGTAVGAGQIDLTLRGVHGQVRFFGDLEPILRRIESHRAEPGS